MEFSKPLRRPCGSPRTWVPLTLVLLGFCGVFAQTGQEEPGLNRLLREAVRVLVLAKRDSIAAAKESAAVFAAGHALEKAGRRREAVDYFEEGLKLSPWNLDEQLNYARLLISQKQETEAAEIARMVSQRAESDTLANSALKILAKPPVASPPLWDGHSTGPWLCFVKVGSVDDVMLRDSMDKMSRTLGIPAWLLDEKIGMPKANRSSFDRWVTTQIIPQVKWYTPEAMRLLRSLGETAPEDVPPKKLIAALIQSLQNDGLDREAANLRETSAIYQKSDQQWDASNLLATMLGVLRQRPGLESAIIVGITSADLYEGDSNYLFGIAGTGRRHCIVSCARFRADFFGEPPDRSRLVARLHKQLLSSIGFALGVPRPTDPTSARAYPASIAEHDAKSEYMSAACIKGFERALGRPLPAAAHRPDSP